MASSIIESAILPTVFLLGALFLTTVASSLLQLGKFKSKELLRSANPPHFFFLTILKKFFRLNEWENVYFCISLSKHIYELAYAITAFFYLMATMPSLQGGILADLPSSHHWTPLIWAALAIIFLFVLLDFTLRLLASVWSRPLLRLTAPFASIYLSLLFPLTAALLQLMRTLVTKLHFEEQPVTDRTKLHEMIRESELEKHLDPADQKLISSFVNFKGRVAKEIMVPRVDVFSLAAHTPIREAAALFATEGYSRIPIFAENLDEIRGVVLYKDLLKCFATPNHNLDAPLQTIAKPVLYAPENKKITQLLQEFRNKHLHMAIIVDEYGGTEGIVTIEDILEELVGEIEDEYDIGEAKDFWELPEGGWMVDAKMTLIDIETQLNIKIPPNPEYETIGGYVFHCAGTIPAKGWKLSHDEFDLEVVQSNERSIKKIKITPRAFLKDRL